MNWDKIKGKLYEGYGVLFFTSLMLLTVSFIGLPDKWGNFFIEDTLFQANEAYLAKVEQRATSNAVVLASLNGLLNTVQTSEIGVSIIVKAQVTVGEQIRTLTQLTARGYQCAGAASLVSLVMQMLLQISKDLTPIMFQLVLMSLLVFSFCGWVRLADSLTKLGFVVFRAFLLVFVLVHLTVPYSVHFASIVSGSISEKNLVQTSTYFKNAHAEFSDSKHKASNSDKAKNALHIIEMFQVKISKKIRIMLDNILRYFVAELFVTIIIPLSLFYVIIKLSSYVVFRYVVHPLELVCETEGPKA